MRAGAGIMLLVLAVDAAAAAIFFHVWEPLGACLAVAVLASGLAFRSRMSCARAGRGSWVLGPAAELSDPDRPRCEVAVLSS